MAQGGTYGKVAIDQTINIIAANIMQNAAVALGNGVNLNVQGYVSALISVTGTMSGGTAMTFEASVDDVNFVAITGHQIGFAGNLTTITISPGDFRFSCAGYKSIRARISTYSAGTITAKGYVSTLPGHPTTVNSNIIAALPVGTNTVGAVTGPGAAALALDATLTGNNQRTRLTDGTNLAAIDSAGNLAFKGGFAEQASLTAPALNSFLVASTDVSAYKSFSIQINAIAGSSVLTMQGSNDNTNWFQVAAMQQGLGTSTSITQITSTGIYNGGIGFRFLRIQQTSWTSGTTTGTLELYAWAFVPTNIGISGTVNGVGAAGSTVTALGNPFSIVGADGGSVARYILTTTAGAIRNQPIDPTSFTLSSAAGTNATNIKATAGTLYQITCSNVLASVAFVKLFNTAAAPTVGTTVPVLTMAVPANGVPLNINFDALGMRFSSGISLSITNSVADSDVTAVAAAQIKVMATYI